MVERPDSNFGSAAGRPSDAAFMMSQVDAWFTREVLPLEGSLMQFLRRNWRNKSEIADLRQEVYVRVYEAASRAIPERPRQFLFATARNLLVDRVRQAQVIPIAAASDFETLEVASDAPGPEHIVQARDELRRVQAALDRLPPRQRKAVLLKRVEGFSRRAIAERMGVTESTAAKYLAEGICALVDALSAEQEPAP
jgi:RNA polymerase sigma factor (sigma-70 family)